MLRQHRRVNIIRAAWLAFLLVAVGLGPSTTLAFTTNGSANSTGSPTPRLVGSLDRATPVRSAVTRDSSPATQITPVATRSAPINTQLREAWAPAIARKWARNLGPYSQSKPMEILIPLRPRDPAGLRLMAMSVVNPHSPLFGHYMSFAAIQRRYGPSPAAIAATTDWLRAHGITTVYQYPDSIAFWAPLTAVEELFMLHLDRWRLADGSEFFGPDQAPTIPTSLADKIATVIGLDNAARLQPLEHAVSHRRATAPRPRLGQCGSDGGYTPTTLRNAYDVTAALAQGLDGSGQTIDLFELDGYNPANITTFDQQCGVGGGPIVSYVCQDQPDGPATCAAAPPLTPSSPTEQEVESDIEVVQSIAPQATIHVYQLMPSSQSSTPDAVIYHLFQAIIAAGDANIASVSYGLCEPLVSSATLAAMDTLLSAGNLAHMGVYVASGDNGSYGCHRFVQLTGQDPIAVSWPASDPNVTAVGGTALSVGPDGTAYQSETAWNDVAVATSAWAGGGGGVSTLPRPAYQNGLNPPQLGGASGRMVPDVSANADLATGYSIYTTGVDANGNLIPPQWQTIGGTSLAAPLWAGVMALANQAIARVGGAPIGFANPILYNLATGPSYNSLFHDVPPGSDNDVNPSDTSHTYSTSTGYDLATGWGSMDAMALINALESNTGPTNTGSGIAPPLGTFNVTIQGTVSGVPVSLPATLMIVQPYISGNHPLDVCLVTGDYQTILLGNGPEGALALASDERCFSVQTSDTADVTIDPSTQQLTVSPVSALGPNSTSFFLLGVSGLQVQQFIYGGSMTLLFDSSGNISGNLDILGSDTGFPIDGVEYQATITGSFPCPSGTCGGGNPGGALGVSPTSIDFGNVAVGSTSSPQNVTITNNGNSTLSNWGVSTGGTNPSDFGFLVSSTCISGNNLIALQPHASCTLAEVFQPTVAGPRSATLTIADAQGDSSTVALNGTGGSGNPGPSPSPSPSPRSGGALGVSPLNVGFGTVAVGSTSSPQNVTVTNNGNSVLGNWSVNTGGANPNDFGFFNSSSCISGNTLIALQAHASCTLALGFQPSAGGPRSATLTVADTQGDSSMVSLNGMGSTSGGGSPSPSPSPIVPSATPAVNVPQTSVAQTATTVAQTAVAAAQHAAAQQTSAAQTAAAAVQQAAVQQTSAAQTVAAAQQAAQQASAAQTAAAAAQQVAAQQTSAAQTVAAAAQQAAAAQTSAALAVTASHGSGQPQQPAASTPTVSSSSGGAVLPAPTQPAAGASRSSNGPSNHPTQRLFFDHLPRSVVNGGMLTISLHTAPRGTVAITLRVTSSQVVYTGKGKHRKRSRHSIVLYNVGKQGVADSHGRFLATLHVVYKAVKPVQATLVVSVMSTRGTTISKSQTISILPQHLKKHGH